MGLKLATEKTYTHAVFSIADPVVKSHIEQAIYACKFRIRFPAFYYFLALYTTNFTEPLSYQDSAFLKLPKFP